MSEQGGKSIRLIAMVLAVAVGGQAQTSRGTVTGTVLDPTGAVIGGARVILAGVETGAKLSTDSNEAGVYRFDAVDLGVYELRVTHPGFHTFLETSRSSAAELPQSSKQRSHPSNSVISRSPTCGGIPRFRTVIPMTAPNIVDTPGALVASRLASAQTPALGCDWVPQRG
jgi:hypothetical protein